MPVTVVQLGFVNGGQSQGAKRPSWGRVWEGGTPRYREIVCIFMHENDVFLHIIFNAIIRGYRLCEVAYINPYPPPVFPTVEIFEIRV